MKSLKHPVSSLVHERSVPPPLQCRGSEPESQLDARMVESHGFGQVFNAQPTLQLKAFITGELQACRQVLIADQQVEMKNFMAALEARFQAKFQECIDLVKSSYLHLESRIDSLAYQDVSKCAELREFKHETLAHLERFAECLQVCNQEWHNMETKLASILHVNEPVASTKPHGSAAHDLEGTCGRKHNVVESRSIAPNAAFESRVPNSIMYHGITSGEAEHGQIIKVRTNTAPSPATPPKKSTRVKALEMALTSMAQQEQEQIRCLRQQIREAQPVQMFQNSTSNTQSQSGCVNMRIREHSHA